MIALLFASAFLALGIAYCVRVIVHNNRIIRQGGDMPSRRRTDAVQQDGR